mmetsp:Transcript_30735/g.102361  ORF Transcript_30735/g.102361 Transcript_30735/m.102361 type:complete len:239 (-) Transcript_30735:67-783(-)
MMTRPMPTVARRTMRRSQRRMATKAPTWRWMSLVSGWLWTGSQATPRRTRPWRPSNFCFAPARHPSFWRAALGRAPWRISPQGAAPGAEQALWRDDCSPVGSGGSPNSSLPRLLRWTTTTTTTAATRRPLRTTTPTPLAHPALGPRTSRRRLHSSTTGPLPTSVGGCGAPRRVPVVAAAAAAVPAPPGRRSCRWMLLTLRWRRWRPQQLGRLPWHMVLVVLLRAARYPTEAHPFRLSS